MKDHHNVLGLSLVSILATLLIFIFLLSNKNIPQNTNTELRDIDSPKGLEEKGEKGNNNFNLSPEEQKDLWKKIEQLPNDNVNAINKWVNYGPYGFVQPLQRYSIQTGRILDAEITSTGVLRVAAASGGLWEGYLNPLTENLNTQITTSFATKPNDINTIFVGTGEPGTLTPGTGLWKTTDKGNTWTQSPSYPSFLYCYKLRYDEGNASIIHMATNTGYFRSDDGGATWTNRYSGNISDFSLCAGNTPIVYIAVFGSNIYKSTNGGNNFSATSFYFNDHSRLAVCAAPGNENTLFVNAVKASDQTTRGIYKSTNGGTNYTLLYNQDIHWGQGDYNNDIAVSSGDPKIVLAGGCELLRTSNGGDNWSKVIGTGTNQDWYNLHYDIQRIKWTSATTVYVCSDGGIAKSTDAGLTWTTTNINKYPVAQFYHFDVSNDGKVIGGGLQDNGFIVTTNGSVTWDYTHGGDGTGFVIDENNNQNMLGGIKFNGTVRKTTNYGVNWFDFISGINSPGAHLAEVKKDRGLSSTYYFLGKYNVYKLPNSTSTWVDLNNGSNFPFETTDIEVVTYTISNPNTFYVTLNSTDNNNRIKYYSGGAYSERSAGIVPGGQVRKISLGRYELDDNIYAIMEGVSTNEKIYKSINKGLNWTNITGNLPNLFITSLVQHPTDPSKLYIGTYGTGCFKTTDGGTTWSVWNNGMPKACLVHEFRYIDSSNINGKFYVVAATYGRGIYEREISGDDPIAVLNYESTVPKDFTLMQNYPNPFNPETVIKFDVPSKKFVHLGIIDIAGHEVEEIVNKELAAGRYSYTWNASKYSSGIYFYKLQSDNFVSTRKMIFIK